MFHIILCFMQPKNDVGKVHFQRVHAGTPSPQLSWLSWLQSPPELTPSASASAAADPQGLSSSYAHGPTRRGHPVTIRLKFVLKEMIKNFTGRLYLCMCRCMCIAALLHGRMNAWMLGCFDPWIHGYVDARMDERICIHMHA